MQSQNYANHHRFVPTHHFLASTLFFLALCGAVVNLIKPELLMGRFPGLLILVLGMAGFLNWFHLRNMTVRLQDRVIRSEENFRHYVLTGKPLSADLAIRQIVGLRFAQDGEFLELTKRAVTEKMSNGDIKKIIKNWRADYHRA